MSASELGPGLNEDSPKVTPNIAFGVSQNDLIEFYSSLGTLEILLERKKQLEPPPNLPLYKDRTLSSLCKKVTAKADEHKHKIESHYHALQITKDFTSFLEAYNF